MNDRDDGSKQDEAFIGDSLKETKNKSADGSNGMSQNMSSEKFIFENIQRSIDIIGQIQGEMKEQANKDQTKEDHHITKSGCK